MELLNLMKFIFARLNIFWRPSVQYITPAGIRMDFNEFTPGFIETLEDPLEYYFTRYQILEYLHYFKDYDIEMIKRLQEDNIRNLPMDPLDQYDIIQLGIMLRKYDQIG